MENLLNELIRRAAEARAYSYAPYSDFKVGAALLTEEGKIYTGCNVENAAYSPGNCAERTAFFKAVSEGERNFRAICIVNENAEGKHDFCPPCGMCRQVMAEFCDADTFQIILAKSEREVRVYKLRELFPMGFGPGYIK